MYVIYVTCNFPRPPSLLKEIMSIWPDCPLSFKTVFKLRNRWCEWNEQTTYETASDSGIKRENYKWK